MANGLGNIPTLDAVQPAAVQGAAAAIGKAGVGIQNAGNEVASAWGKLHGVYVAPEAWELFAAIKPVQSKADQFGWQVGQVGAALSDYAAEIAPIKVKLAALKSLAEVMLAAQAATPGGESHWRRKQSNVDAENKLLHEAAVAQNEAKAIAAKCANRINGLYAGGVQYHAGATGEGGPNNYWSNDSAHLWWAKPVQRDKAWYEDGWDGIVGGVKGFAVDGAWGLVKGIGGMAGFDSHGWDWHTMWHSYKAIETLGAPLMVPGAALALPSVRKAWKQTGKDLVAWDTWKKDKGRAAGNVVFNVITLGIPESRLALAGKAGDAALAVTKAMNKVDVVGHGVNFAVKNGIRGAAAGMNGIRGLSKMGAGLSHLPDIHVNGLDHLPDTPTPKINPGHFHLNDPGVSAPHPPHDPLTPTSPHVPGEPKTPSLGTGHAPVAHGKPPTVRQLSDHLGSKYERDLQHLDRKVGAHPKQEHVTVGGKRPATPGARPHEPGDLNAYAGKDHHTGGAGKADPVTTHSPGTRTEGTGAGSHDEGGGGRSGNHPGTHGEGTSTPHGKPSDHGPRDPGHDGPGAQDHGPYGGEHGHDGSNGHPSDGQQGHHAGGARHDTAHTEPHRFKTTPMQPKYRGEHLDGNDIFKHLRPPSWGDKGVAYLTPEQLAKTKIEIRDGRLYNAKGEPFDTGSAPKSAWSGESRGIFVMDGHGNLYAFQSHAPGVFHHSSFLGGKDVAAAGEIKVTDGRLETLTDDSGHYLPSREFTHQAIERLKELGIDFSDVNVYMSTPFI